MARASFQELRQFLPRRQADSVVAAHLPEFCFRPLEIDVFVVDTKNCAQFLGDLPRSAIDLLEVSFRGGSIPAAVKTLKPPVRRYYLRFETTEAADIFAARGYDTSKPRRQRKPSMTITRQLASVMQVLT
jgi:hypothetical protein